MGQRRDVIRLWQDSSVPGGLELLRAQCFDFHYPSHFHAEFTIAAFVRGAQKHRISRHEGIAEADTVMIIPPGEVHRGEAVERDHGWDYCAFYPSARFLEQIADDVLGGHGGIDFGSDVTRHDPIITRDLLRANTIMAASKDVLERQCAAYETFGAVIARYGERTRRRPGRSSSRAAIGHAIAFLEEHHDRPITVSEIAAVANLSDYHFMRSFRAETGLSVHRYLTQVRICRAKALLSRGVSAAETAIRVGFFDQSHLINQFRIHLGTTPGSFVAASK